MIAKKRELMGLNEKLLIWRGFREYSPNMWFSPDADLTAKIKVVGRAPYFPDSLDLCFKWLVPRLDATRNIRHIIFSVSSSESPPTKWVCEIVWFLLEEGEMPLFGKGDSPAMAFCKACEKARNEKRERC